MLGGAALVGEGFDDGPDERLDDGPTAGGPDGPTIKPLEQPAASTARRTVAMVAKPERRGDGIGGFFQDERDGLDTLTPGRPGCVTSRWRIIAR